MKIKLLFLFVLINIVLVNAQPVQFNQYQSNTLYNNPAFTGTSEQPLFSAYFGQAVYVKDLYSSSPYNDYTPIRYIGDNFALSYQQYWNKIRGSFGIKITSNYYPFESNYHCSTQSINFSYSPTIKILKKLCVKPSIEIGYYSEKLTAPEVIYTLASIDTFSTTSSQYYQYNYNIQEIPNNFTSDYYNINSGILFYTKNFHLGFSLGHLNLPKSYGFHVGYNSHNPNLQLLSDTFYITNTYSQNSFTFNSGFNINSKDSTKTWTISPHFYLKYDDYAGYILLGSGFRYKKVIAGLDLCTYDNNGSAIIFTLGYQVNRFMISYGYTTPAFYILISDNIGTKRSLNSIQLIYSLPKKEHSTPPVYTSMY